MLANLLLAVCLATPLLFAGTVWLSRAGAKRTSAAVASCLTVTVFSLGWDALATRMGWWSYHSNDVLVTLAFSVTIAFLFGGVAAIASWRMMRAMGWTGAITFSTAFIGIGLLRDHTLEINTDVFEFGDGLAPQAMAALGYLAMALIVQMTMLLLAGPPTRDELRGDYDIN